MLSYHAYSQKSDIHIIHAGTLLAVPGSRPLREQTIVVDQGKIMNVFNGYKSNFELGYEEVNVIDLTKYFVLPGLIDMHTHITGERDPERNPHEWLTRYDADYALESIPYLEKTLMAGFTTIRKLTIYLKQSFASQ